MFHASRLGNRELIQEQGLKPSYDGYTYLWDNYEEAKKYADYKASHWLAPYDIWTVDASDIPIKRDPWIDSEFGKTWQHNMENDWTGAWRLEAPIPPDRIQLTFPEGTKKEANIFDPIQDELDQNVFQGITPRRTIVAFIKRTFFNKMQEKGIPNPENYFRLVITGSLTTYQYSETSDLDISVAPDYNGLASLLGLPTNEVRRQLIRAVTADLDGTFVPGTRHPLQYFVLNLDDDLLAHFKPGMRSGWDLQTQQWIVPPEHERSHDVQKDLPELFIRASAIAEKMRLLLDSGHEDEAKTLFAQIHAKRSLDEQEGLGDFAEGNIVYKYLLHEGLFDRLKGIGVRISSMVVRRYRWGWYNGEVKVIVDSDLSLTHPDMAEQWDIWNSYSQEKMDDVYFGYADVDTKGTVKLEFTSYDFGDKSYVPDHVKSDIIAAVKALAKDKTAGAAPVSKASKHQDVIYDFNRDRVILADGLNHDHVRPDDHIIIGNYDGENVNLSSTHKQFLNANYFKKLWLNSFPTHSLREVYINEDHIPTRSPDQMTYLQKNPVAIENPEVALKLAAEPWRKGKDWKDFIKNKGIIVEFQIGDDEDETFDGKVNEVHKDGIEVLVGAGEHRTLDAELLEQMKFKVKDDKHHLSAIRFEDLSDYPSPWEEPGGYRHENDPGNEPNTDDLYVMYRCAFVYLGRPLDLLLCDKQSAEHQMLLQEWVDENGGVDAWEKLFRTDMIAGHVGVSTNFDHSKESYIYVIYSGFLGDKLDPALESAAKKHLEILFPNIREANRAEYEEDWYGVGY
jgi:hypothetical protein